MRRRALLANTAASLLGVACSIVSLQCSAQTDYEIQIYGSETVPAGRTMVEVHSNYTIDGQRQGFNGVYPSRHALHETLEITHGFTPWFETGFYVFSSIQPGAGWEWVGDNIRPRVRIPEEWKWPVGLSLSTEIGYSRRSFTEDTWSWELRPIIDKQIGPWYISINPSFEKSLHGLNSAAGWEFAPSAKLSYDVTKVIALGVEYYSSLGTLTHFESWNNQEHQIVPVIDLNFSEDWEFNFGIGFGLSRSTENLMVKLILGRRF